MTNENISRLAVLGGASGILGTICYIIAGTVDLSLALGYAVAMAWPILSIIFFFSLYRYLGLNHQSAANQLALVFGFLAFTLVAAMLSAQLAVKAGIAEDAAKASQSQQEMLTLIRRSVRLVDIGLDVAWDVFMCTAMFFFSYSLGRHPRFGRWWALPMVLLAAGLLVLNVATFPWPPDTKGLIDLGPFAGLFFIALSARLLYLGMRMKQPAVAPQAAVN